MRHETRDSRPTGSRSEAVPSSLSHRIYGGLLLLLIAALLSLSGCGEAEPPLALDEIDLPVTDSESFAPRLSVDDSGQVYLSWLAGKENGGHAFRFARHDGVEWSEPMTVSSGEDWFANWADTPGVRPVGDWLFAHWLVRSGPGTYHYNIHAAWSKDGGKSWGEPFILHGKGRQAEHGFLSSTVLPTGELAVSWLDGRHTVDGHSGHSHGNGSMTLRWARFQPGQNEPVHDEELDDRVCDCCMTATVLESDGPRVFYRNRSEEEIRDIYSVRPEHAAERRPVRDDGWNIAACPVNGPAAQAVGNRSAVLWYTAAAGDGQVRFAFDDSGSSQVVESRRVDEGRPLGRVAMAGDDEGLVLFWMEEGDEGAIIMGREAGENGLGPARPLTELSAARSSGVPAAVATEEGILLAWTALIDGERRLRAGWLNGWAPATP